MVLLKLICKIYANSPQNIPSSTLLYALETITAHAHLRSHSCFPDRLIILNEDFVEILKKFFACRAFVPAAGHITTAIKKIMPNTVSQSRMYANLQFPHFSFSKNNHHRSGAPAIDRFFIPNFFYKDSSQTNGKIGFRTGEFLQGYVWLGGCLACPHAISHPCSCSTNNGLPS